MPEPKVILITGASRGIGATLALSWPAKRFRSNWMAVIIHGGEGILMFAAILAAALGMKPG